MGWPAVVPRFAKAAWLGIVPEFNPFKYNSFPVNGARQSSLVARTLQQQIDAAARAGRLAELPPILTFQSVVDFTVSTRAIVDALYARLPANGSELVLFDVNRQVQFDRLLRPGVDLAIARLLPAAPRDFRTAFVTNASAERADVVERVVEAGQSGEAVRELGLAYPGDVYSLSHLALPFPLGDALYGLKPEPGEDFGVHLGAIAARGERGILLFSMDAMLRMSSNPFFPYLLGRIEEGIVAPR
jgi:alpha-beta hydrolase superfamily lysophospholipase